MSELPDFLQVCIYKFWEDNQELRDRFLRDLYVHGRATAETNEQGRLAVDIWLKNRAPVSNGERG